MLLDKYVHIKLKNTAKEIRDKYKIACNIQSLADYYLREILYTSEINEHVNAVNHFKKESLIKKRNANNKKILSIETTENPVKDFKEIEDGKHNKHNLYNLKIKKVIN